MNFVGFVKRLGLSYQLFALCVFVLGSEGCSDAQTTDTLQLSYVSDSQALPYTLFKFGEPVSSDFKTPLVLYLHGAGERGKDNMAQINHILPVLLETLKHTSEKSFYLLAPQCPENEKWVNTEWSALSHQMDSVISWPLDFTIRVMDSIIRIDKLDTNRIYLTGISMGGFGVWELLQRYPGKFAAAIPVCGGGDLSFAGRIKDIPVWAFHGKKDKLVKVSRTMDMVTAINKAGGMAKMTLYRDLGHGCWNRVYENKKVVNWMLSQSRHEK